MFVDCVLNPESLSRNLEVYEVESYLNDLQHWLSECLKISGTIFACTGRRFIQPRPVTLLGEPIEWVEISRYLRVNLHVRLTWSPNIDQVRKMAIQRMGMLDPVLDRNCDLSVRNGALLYTQLILPVMDYACPAWRPADCTQIGRLHVLQSKCLRLVLASPGT